MSTELYLVRLSSVRLVQKVVIWDQNPSVLLTYRRKAKQQRTFLSDILKQNLAKNMHSV